MNVMNRLQAAQQSMKINKAPDFQNIMPHFKKMMPKDEEFEKMQKLIRKLENELRERAAKEKKEKRERQQAVKVVPNEEEEVKISPKAK